MHFGSVEEVERALEADAYLADRGLATAVYLALAMPRPLLLLEMERCGDGRVRDLIVDRRAEEDDPLVQARAARGEAARSSA